MRDLFNMHEPEVNSKVQSDAPTFHDERRSGLGGSDAGAVYNLGFKCARATTYEKRGTPQDFPKRDTVPELERGIVMEPACKLVYERRTNRKVDLKPLARHPDHDWMIVHIDGETTSPQHAGPGYVEFKVINRFVMQRFLKEGVRDEYVLQLQHGMAVKGYQWGSFGILCLDPWRFEWFDVDRDQGLIDKLIEDEEKLWVQVQNGPIPEALPDIKDKRCATCPWRRTCRGELLAQLADSSEHAGGAVPQPDLLPLVEETVELKQIVSDAQELSEDAVQRLKDAIGERYGIIVPGYRALYPTSYPERWDTKALEGIKLAAETVLKNDEPLWDLQSLEQYCLAAKLVLEQIVKAKKPPKKERSLRIYATGD